MAQIGTDFSVVLTGGSIFVAPTDCTLLSVTTSIDTTDTDINTATVRLNAVATAIASAVAVGDEVGATTASSLAVAKGDRIDFAFDNGATGTGTAAACHVTLWFQRA